MKLGTRFVGLIVVTVVGCSSSNFDVTAAPGEDTGGSADTSSVTETSIEPGDDAPPPPPPEDTGGGTESGTGCAAISNPTEIWVDGTSTIPSPTGASTCPFRRINEAIAYANTLELTTPRTIKVKPGIYDEASTVVLRKGLTLTGAGVGVTKLTGGGLCMGGTTGYHCVVRVDGGGTLERVTVDAAPGGKHGVVTGAPGGSFPIVRSTVITGATGSAFAGVLVTGGALLGPNIESSGNGYGLVIWGSQSTKVLAGTNKFDSNTVLGINHEGTGVFTFEGGSVSSNTAGIQLGEPVASPPPVHVISNAVVKGNIEFGIKVRPVASAKIRGCTITGSKFGVIAIHGASNYIDLGNAGGYGLNNFGSSSAKNSLGSICALLTRSTPLDATGNTFPDCSTARSLSDLGTDAGCEAVTTYNDVWYRGLTVPITANCTKG